MSYSVQTAKAELEPMLHGTTLNQVGNIEGVFNRAGRQLLLDIDPVETKRVAQLSRLVYDGVFTYAPPADLKKDKVIDLYVAYQAQNNLNNPFTQIYNRNFNTNKNTATLNTFNILNNTGVKTLQIDYNNASRTIVLNTANDLTANGTWAAGGTASNLSIDYQTILNGSTPIMFDITTGTGTITNSTMTAIDISGQQSQSGIFWQIIVPTASNLTSVGIRFGSSATDYYEITGITTDFQGNAFSNGLNQIYGLWANATTTGSPDSENIDYIRLSFVASGSISGMEFAYITSQLGWYMNIEYYSRYIFSTSGGTWQETVTDDSNLINLDTDSYNIFLYQLAFLCVQQALGQNAAFDTNIFLNKYNESVARYKRMYKSEIIKPQSPYYVRTFNGYQNWLGTNWPGV